MARTASKYATNSGKTATYGNTPMRFFADTRCSLTKFCCCASRVADADFKRWTRIAMRCFSRNGHFSEHSFALDSTTAIPSTYPLPPSCLATASTKAVRTPSTGIPTIPSIVRSRSSCFEKDCRRISSNLSIHIATLRMTQCRAWPVVNWAVFGRSGTPEAKSSSETALRSTVEAGGLTVVL